LEVPARFFQKLEYEARWHPRRHFATQAILARSVIWLWMTGEWPPDEIDHRDMDGTNNKWGNLRKATHADNMHNQKPRHHNTSGFKGVHRRANGKWRASIGIDGKRINLGTFSTAAEAGAAYGEAARKLHGEFARQN
jgi:hypothetical protein